MKKGDIIYCCSEDDLIHTMIRLAKSGIETGFVYDTDAEWVLVVTKVRE